MSAEASQVSSANPASRVPRLAGAMRRAPQYAFPLALLALIVYGAIGYSAFRSGANVRNILDSSAVLLIVALGQTLVILTRGADLAVGSMVGLTGAIYAHLYTTGTAEVLAIAAALGVGVAVGILVHGLLITKAKISFLIVTLGTYSILASQADIVLNGNAVVVNSTLLSDIANNQVLGIPVIAVVAFVIYGLLVLVTRCTGYGRAVYAVGSNPDAARLAGLPVDRIIIISFGICSLLAAIAGILTVGQLGSAQTTAGVGLELQSIAAVLVGGTRFSGGHGGMTKTLMGVLFLSVLDNLLLIVGLSSFWQQTFAGLVLIVAVGVDRTRQD
jgi:ribose transport system permease protein